MSLLVIGADSMIGSALLNMCKRINQPAFGSTRRRHQTSDERFFLDLGEPSSFDNIPAPVETAIICAGVTKLDVCKAKPEQTAKTNVTGVIALAQRLLNNGVHIIYLSTDKVFDGSAPSTAEAEPPRPTTEYGRQRAVVERELKSLSDEVALVRLNKVLGPHNPLFDLWGARLLQGEKIHPFSDLFIAPVPLWLVVDALQKLAVTKLAGVFHISGARNLSYADIARIGAEALGADIGLVEPVTADTAGVSKSPSTTLSCARLNEQFGITPPDVESTIITAFNDPTTLAGAYVAHL